MVRATSTKVLSVKKSKNIKPYKKGFSFAPLKKTAKVAGILALLGASAYGSKKLYDARVVKGKKPTLLITYKEVKPHTETPVVSKEVEIPIPRESWAEITEEDAYLRKRIDAFYLLQKEFSKSKGSRFAGRDPERIIFSLDDVCTDYDEFISFYNKGCKYSQEVLSPGKYKGKIGSCRKKYLQRDAIDSALVEELMELFDC